MASICVKNYVKSVRHFPDGKESTADKLQRQLRELERRVDKYFDDLDNVEIICEQAKADIERFQLKAKVEKEILKKDAEIQMKLFSAVREMNDKVKTMKEQDTALHAEEDKMPDAAQNALRYTTSYRVCRYIKIGCGLVLDTVAAYALFKVTKPFFF
ncbi:uncharacterized protein LOC144648283 [Oculina patagonica]